MTQPDSPSKRGGPRKGAGRPSQGKATFNLSLNAEIVAAAKKRTSNLSGTVDKLLTAWLKK